MLRRRTEPNTAAARGGGGTRDSSELQQPKKSCSHPSMARAFLITLYIVVMCAQFSFLEFSDSIFSDRIAILIKSSENNEKSLIGKIITWVIEKLIE